MYHSGQQQLQSTAWLQRHAADRPSFKVLVRKTLSTTPYQAFVLPRGLLFLERRDIREASDVPGNAIVAGAVLGGAIGAVIGAALSQGAESSVREENLDVYDEEDLIDIARRRKKSFVAKLDEILSVSIDAPGSLARMFGDSRLAGWVTLRDQVLGKITLEVHDQPSLAVAVDSLPRRLGGRVHVNVEFDAQKQRFAPKFTS